MEQLMDDIEQQLARTKVEMITKDITLFSVRNNKIQIFKRSLNSWIGSYAILFCIV